MVSHTWEGVRGNAEYFSGLPYFGVFLAFTLDTFKKTTGCKAYLNQGR